MLKLRKNGVDKMKALLNDVQAYLILNNEQGALDDYQLSVIPSTKTFLQFGAEIDRGLSVSHGLIKYCDNAINVVKSGVKKNKINVPIVIHIGEKMAHVAWSLRNVIDVDTLSDDEKSALHECEANAKAWLDNTGRASLLVDVDERVNLVKQRLSEKGVLEMIRNQNEVLEPLLSWA